MALSVMLDRISYVPERLVIRELRFRRIAGARMVVADVDRAKVSAMVGAYGATEVAPNGIAAADVDVLAPCALGATLDGYVVSRMRARVVCGAANNQLATEAAGGRLARAGILYAPDFLVNAGGIISVAGEYLGWSATEVERRVDAIPGRLGGLLNAGEMTGERPELLARRQARSIIAAGVRTPALEAAL